MKSTMVIFFIISLAGIRYVYGYLIGCVIPPDESFFENIQSVIGSGIVRNNYDAGALEAYSESNATNPLLFTIILLKALYQE